MKIFDNPNVDTGFKILGGILVFFGIRKLFSQADGKKGFSLYDFQKAVAFFFFLGGCVWIMKIESERLTEHHKFDALWMALFITGLFSVLGMDKVPAMFHSLLELIIKLRSKVTTTEKTEVSQTTTVSATKKEEPAPVKEKID